MQGSTHFASICTSGRPFFLFGVVGNENLAGLGLLFTNYTSTKYRSAAALTSIHYSGQALTLEIIITNTNVLLYDIVTRY
jgi:hypothetical protein